MLFSDPNSFDGEIAVKNTRGRGLGDGGHHAALSSRGTGVLDMARAFGREGRIVRGEQWATRA